ncbi:DUF7573 domain-containing protein [Natronolimnobius baerhuensis]|uniref:DUF7573 domain-containing protein n=1 Tax=Natronolimnobius baerhuensis TaxID=253108 RepID=A0A202EA77_9EURY|nr:hypothetical protein [Natronolimnobius baerhuensis]OVE85127.1 hypothetical protein B2G88_12350 [Natronolimnobius baerhuensis]
MSDDTRLSDFGSEGVADEVDGERAGGSEEDESEATAATELATYAWGEYVCTRCDAESERVWRDDGAFVCPDCKEW